jgi:response regulator RpfG family c-di-GMP phosphodiesterase
MEKHTVLIVDDDQSSIEILSEALGDDYEIVFALNGAQALSTAYNERVDLILLDLVLPDMSGYSVCRSLKAHPVVKDVPVIFITAMGDAEQEAAGLELGAVDYISKPIQPMIVRLRVRNHLELKIQRDALEQKNKELHEAIGKIDLLSGLIPICAECKKIRNDSGYWEQIEYYLHTHSGVAFSHGICPTCAEKARSDFAKSSDIIIKWKSENQKSGNNK